jgi:uncharacterized protein YndB with AHSA1/START domain
MKSTCIPDLSARPLTMTVERLMKASAEDLYKAWTERFDWWFAEPRQLIMVPEVDKAWFFYNRKDWGSHPHYGRFLELEKNKLVSMTWLTGENGTEGRETVITVELSPQDGGTLLRLTHSGFPHEQSCDGHKENWPAGLESLDEGIAKHK